MSMRVIIVIAVLAVIAAFFLVRAVRQVKAMRRSLTDVCREEFRLQATRSWQYAALLLGAIVVAFGVGVGIFTIPTFLERNGIEILIILALLSITIFLYRKSRGAAKMAAELMYDLPEAKELRLRSANFFNFALFATLLTLVVLSHLIAVLMQGGNLPV